MKELDPKPYVHSHYPECFENGRRTGKPTGTGWYFDPRPGYSQQRQDYE